MSNSKIYKGFPLIELLVVISIIALLVSILLPALNSAWEQARMAVCLAHLSGVGKGMVIYANDNQDKLPPPGGKTRWFFDDQNMASWLTYFEPETWTTETGPAHLGFLYLAGTIENDSEVMFCPSFKGASIAGYSGQRTENMAGTWNSHGDPTPWNYGGVDSSNTSAGHVHHLLAKDEVKIDWINMRVSYGSRNMHNIQVRTYSKAKRMSGISNVWTGSPGGSLYRIHIDELAHTSKDSSMTRLSVWYFDGHVSKRELSRSKFFNSGSDYSTLSDGFMNDDFNLT